MRKQEESKQFYQQVYSLSMEDMMDVWIETFHPFGVVLVIWDASNHFETLRECGVLVNKMKKRRQTWGLGKLATSSLTR